MRYRVQIFMIYYHIIVLLSVESVESVESRKQSSVARTFLSVLRFTDASGPTQFIRLSV